MSISIWGKGGKAWLFAKDCPVLELHVEFFEFLIFVCEFYYCIPYLSVNVMASNCLKSFSQIYCSTSLLASAWTSHKQVEVHLLHLPSELRYCPCSKDVEKRCRGIKVPAGLWQCSDWGLRSSGSLVPFVTFGLWLYKGRVSCRTVLTKTFWRACPFVSVSVRTSGLVCIFQVS